MTFKEINFNPPIAPSLLKEFNQKRIANLETKLNLSPSPEQVISRCQERIALCELLQKIDTDNPAWLFGRDFFEAFPEGPEVLWQVFDDWGLIGPGDQLTPSEEMLQAQPREILDLTEKAVKTMPNFKTLDIKRAAQIIKDSRKGEVACWQQYQVVKTELLRATTLQLAHIVTGRKLPEKISQIIESRDGQAKYLLADDFIGKTLRMAEKYSLPIAVLGLSADEIEALKLRHPENDLTVIGIAKGYSPALEEKINSDDVKIIRIQKANDPQKLEPGYYLIPADARDGLPFISDSVCAVMMNALHHNTPKQQQELIREMVRVAFKPSPRTAAVQIVEPYNSQRLLAMVLVANQNYETSAFDASFGTTVCGGQTPEEMKNFAHESSPEINWKTGLFPSLPPFSFIQSRICYQQVALSGC